MGPQKRVWGILALPALLVGLSALAQLASAADAGPSPGKWAEILGPSQGKPPAPREKVFWRSDLPAAMKEAQQSNRPLFVTLRCLPCKQCSAFDKAVLEGGAELDPLLKQFITVRLTDAQAVDLRLLPMEGFQDFDLSWWGWFLSPVGQVYGVFGGRDKVSDETRISPAALATTLKRVLAYHDDPRRSTWNLDGPAPDLAGEPKTPKDLPGYAHWKKAGGPEVQAATCIHCHQVAEIIRQPAIEAKTFDKQRDLRIWPLPENVGVAVDRDDGLRVKSVEPGSPAARAGVKVGDELAAAGGRKLFSQADLRGVLQRGPAGAGTLELWWTRDGRPMNGTLELPDGWRDTPAELDWRMSVSQGNIGAGPGFFPLGANAQKRQARGIANGRMAVEPYFSEKPQTAVWKAGMRRNDIITAVGDQSPNINGRAFLVWFRRHYDVGDTVTFTAVDEQGQERKISCKLEARDW
jgi:serine protease Do